MSDAGTLAELRWRFQTENKGIPTDDNFITIFNEAALSERFIHWVAELNGKVVAIMSVQKVAKLPSPGDRSNRHWGYLTNCYTVPEHRNKGIGGSLLTRVRKWAEEEGLEFLAVWPSDRSYGFYEREGFSRPPDPLILKIQSK